MYTNLNSGIASAYSREKQLSDAEDSILDIIKVLGMYCDQTTGAYFYDSQKAIAEFNKLYTEENLEALGAANILKSARVSLEGDKYVFEYNTNMIVLN